MTTWPFSRLGDLRQHLQRFMLIFFGTKWGRDLQGNVFLKNIQMDNHVQKSVKQ